MLQFDIASLQAWVGQFLWPLIRVGAFFMVAPIIGTQVVTARIRIILTLLLVIAIAPQLGPMPTVDPLSPLSVVLVAQQLLIGLALGFFLQLLIHIFVMSGQIVATKMGLGFASMNDPANGVIVTVVSQFYLVMVTLLFLAFNGHLVMIEILVESFAVMPVGAELGGARFLELVQWGSWMFAAAVLMALPAVTALLIINCTLGVITRAAPQLNIFAIGFPLMLTLGLCILWVSLAMTMPQFERYSAQALSAMRAWTGAI
ncbi:MAG: flagellar biosynthetic protein FliR [Spongiibacteraceae bacterium]|jgi:flagellar biosynthetic protein FliR|nr:flagellar biosynthetic protein FliR [Spongiibacteraceae bacterium]